MWGALKNVTKIASAQLDSLTERAKEFSDLLEDLGGDKTVNDEGMMTIYEYLEILICS